jgi:hypothetical protein
LRIARRRGILRRQIARREAVMDRTSDFGVRTASGALGGRFTWLVAAGMFAILIVGTAWGVFAERQTIAQSAAETGTIVGPPCPAASRADFESTVKLQGPLPYVFEFNGASFGRYFGYADCSVAPPKDGGLGSYDVCQFTSPSTLYVKTPRGEFYFQPGVGRKATVMTEGGVARCVMAAPGETD